MTPTTQAAQTTQAPSGQQALSEAIRNALNMAMAVLLSVAVLFMASACGEAAKTPQPAAPQPAKPLAVAATLPQWGALAQELGGDHVQVTTLTQRADAVQAPPTRAVNPANPAANSAANPTNATNATPSATSTAPTTPAAPTEFTPTAQDIAALQHADVVLINGAGYDAWSARYINRAANVISAAQTIGATQTDNPYLWFSQDARHAIAEQLRDTFTRLRAQQTSAFTERFNTWQREEEQIETRMAQIRREYDKASYAATQPIAYYFMSDLGLKDATPREYWQTASLNAASPNASDAKAEPLPTEAQVRALQQVLRDKQARLLIQPTAPIAAMPSAPTPSTPATATPAAPSANAQANQPSSPNSNAGTPTPAPPAATAQSNSNTDDISKSPSDMAANVELNQAIARIDRTAQEAQVPIVAISAAMPSSYWQSTNQATPANPANSANTAANNTNDANVGNAAKRHEPSWLAWMNDLLKAIEQALAYQPQSATVGATS